uniref:SAM domain-containing protein n=1 Tax=Leptobrachium leishanense TaxID=445787 RepID=A0A8C5M5W2_9ANUR
MIPMYMTELKLVVAIGFTDRNDARWKTVCDRMTEDVNRRKSTSQATFQEIFLLDKKSVSQPEPQYNCIEPIYIDIGELKQNSMVDLPNIGKFSLGKNQTLRKSVKTSAVTPPALPKPKYETSKRTVEELTKELQLTIKPSVPIIDPPQSKTEPLTGFSTLSSVPKDLHHLTVNQICECLDLLNMGQYMKAFQGAQVDGQFLYCLDDDMMKSCLGMNGLHVVKLKQFRDGWRPNVKE